jgi:glycine cleavage system H protein
VESVKAASDVYAPVAGEVVAANEALTDTLELVNKEPYNAWLFRLAPADPGAVARLLDAAAYAKSIG